MMAVPGIPGSGAEIIRSDTIQYTKPPFKTGLHDYIADQSPHVHEN